MRIGMITINMVMNNDSLVINCFDGVLNGVAIKARETLESI